MQRPIERAWDLQQRWSAAANAAHRRIERLRIANLVLLVAAAGLGAAAGLLDGHPDAVRTLGACAAAVLGTAGLLQQRFLGKSRVADWIAARAAAERLKSAVWHVVARGQDDSESREFLLDTIDAAQRDVVGRVTVLADGAGTPERPVPTVSSIADYREQRAVGQIAWHRERTATLRRRAGLLRNAELAMTVVGIAAGALAAGFPEWGLAPIVGAVTTIAAALAAQLSASKYERIAIGYEDTATRLATLTETFPEEPTDDDARRLVDDVERVLADQNAAWLGLLGSE